MIAGFFCFFSLFCFFGFSRRFSFGRWVCCVSFCFLGLLFYFQDGARKRSCENHLDVLKDLHFIRGIFVIRAEEGLLAVIFYGAHYRSKIFL